MRPETVTARGIPEWLLRAIESEKAGRPDDASDEVFDRIGAAETAGDLGGIREALRKEIVPLCGEEILLALITATASVRNLLPEGEAWAREARKRLIAEFGYDDSVSPGAE